MLVNTWRRRRADETGSTLVSVLIIMLVLSLGALTLAAVVVNTSGLVVDARSQAQSRAAADAGMAETAAQLDRGVLACPDSAGDTVSDTDVAVDGTGSAAYDYEFSCGAGFVTVRVNAEVRGAKTSIQSTYASSSDAALGGDMVFFGTGNVTFTKEVKTSASGRLLSIVVPKASFTCQALIPGNVTARDDISANGGCTIEGTVTSTEGELTMCCGGDTIKGDVTTGGTGSSTVRGTLGGNLQTNGAISFGWEGKRVVGSVIANGNVSLGNVTIKGTLSLPAANVLTVNSGTVSGGVLTPATVDAVDDVDLPSWYEYQFDPSDWPGYTVISLVDSGSGAGTCNYFNSHPATGWTKLSTYATNVVIDARACGSLSTNSGTKPVVTLSHNVVLLAKSFDLTGLTIKAAPGVAEKPKVWVMTEDPVPTDGAPTCASGYGSVGINGTVTDTSVTAMAYTPCTIAVAGKAEGISDAWNGTFYGGGWSYGGGLTFTADPIGAPGMGSDGEDAGASDNLGVLIAQRDVPWVEISG